MLCTCIIFVKVTLTDLIVLLITYNYLKQILNSNNEVLIKGDIYSTYRAFTHCIMFTFIYGNTLLQNRFPFLFRVSSSVSTLDPLERLPEQILRHVSTNKYMTSMFKGQMLFKELQFCLYSLDLIF